jgi:hypothetical protein
LENFLIHAKNIITKIKKEEKEKMPNWVYLSRLKKVSAPKDVKIQLAKKNFNIQNYQSIDYWNNETNNIHNILNIRNAFKVLSYHESAIYNQLIVQTNRNTLNILLKDVKTLEKEKLNIMDDEENDDINVVIIRELQLKEFLIKITVPLITFINSKNLKLLLYEEYSSEPNIDLKAAFQKDQFLPYFNITIHTFEVLFFSNTSSEILSQLIYTFVRRNSQRIKFLVFLKRVIEWYFYQQSNIKIIGIRIEVKGRFIAKSRATKQILIVGNLIQKKANDYKHIVSITKFGSLSIKVWICSKTFI